MPPAEQSVHASCASRADRRRHARFHWTDCTASDSARCRELSRVAHRQPAHERAAVERLLRHRRPCPRTARSRRPRTPSACAGVTTAITSASAAPRRGRECTGRSLRDHDELTRADRRAPPPRAAGCRARTAARADGRGVRAHLLGGGLAVPIPRAEPPGGEGCGGHGRRIRGQVSVGLVGRGRDAVRGEQRIAGRAPRAPSSSSSRAVDRPRRLTGRRRRARTVRRRAAPTSAVVATAADATPSSDARTSAPVASD